MALKTLTQFPIFAPPPSHHHRPPTEIRFSRWNNANAQKFVKEERTQKQIEDELRYHKRFIAADKIANSDDTNPTSDAGKYTFRSTGTPSVPSRPSIPGKYSKYSKPPNSPKSPTDRNGSHPAFRRTVSLRKIPEASDATIKYGDYGVTYAIPEAPFEFQYSYTETPKAKPLKLREPPIAPFGPSTMPRPWTGRKPLPPGKKKIDFDSFRLPPPNKKGVKPVQSPGPFLPGSGPKYVQSREEILGEPLSKEEIRDLVKGSLKSSRQLNMGRDGLTHNMLDNIHNLWKRRRVCKIKCKGVCTVDMDNVQEQLEDKTGGKIIHHRGGVLYLFRGRNYNYKSRPKFPLMLWKPIPPVYPKLIKKIPEGLTADEANEFRAKGRKLTPICNLSKNGVYCHLVKNVREAFEACELVRIDCQGMNPSDYKRIGGKLMELVPCVLLSFEEEHILAWRGREWKSSLLLEESEINNSESSISPQLESKSEEEEPSTSLSTVDQTIDSSDASDASDSDVSETSLSTDTIVQDEIEPVPPQSPNSASMEKYKAILTLLEQAVEGGSALVLDESCLDRDIVYQKVVSFAKSARPGPVFRRPRIKKIVDGEVETEESEKPEGNVAEKEEFKEVDDDLERKVIKFFESRGKEKKSSGVKQKKKKKLFDGEVLSEVVTHGTLRVDELAKLLA